MPTLQPQHTPSLTISLISEEKNADGDDNVAEPRYEFRAVVGISVLKGYEKPEDLDDWVADEADAIETLLLTDTTFITFDPQHCLFEGVPRITRDRFFPQGGETYWCEMRVEMTFRGRVSYPPRVDDDYLGGKITARPAGNGPDTPGIDVKFDAAAD